MLSETENHGIAEDVARGATLLDEKIPGWANRLDTARLEVSDPSHCVLTQLTGNYSRTADEWGIGTEADRHNPCDYGLCCDPTEDVEIAEAWARERAKRIH